MAKKIVPTVDSLEVRAELYNQVERYVQDRRGVGDHRRLYGTDNVYTANFLLGTVRNEEVQIGFNYTLDQSKRVLEEVIVCRNDESKINERCINRVVEAIMKINPKVLRLEDI